jgi:hypothetical protein
MRAAKEPTLPFFAIFPGRESLRAAFENPIAVREWRVLRRRAGDWRFWVGVKWTLDPLIWGAPVVLTYALAPYALWLVLACLRGLKLTPSERLPFDPFLVVVWVFGFYVVSIAQVLGATAVTHEREQQTWEQVWLTRLSGGERAAGYYWGRVGPVLFGSLATLLFWWLLQPHYAMLLRPFWPAVMTRGQLLVATAVTVSLAMLAGLVGLLASALSRQTLLAVVCGSIGFYHLLGALSMMVPFALMPVRWGLGGLGLLTVAAWLVGAISLVIIGICLIGLWMALESALTRHPVPAQTVRRHETKDARTVRS